MRFFLLFTAAGILMGQTVLPRPAPRINLLDACRGEVTVIAFVVTTCPHCQEFSKTLDSLARTKKICAREAAFDEDADITAFVRKLGLSFPVFKIERQAMLRFMGLPAGVRLGTPQIAVIDREGMIQAQSAREGSPLLMQPEVLGAIVNDLLRRRR